MNVYSWMFLFSKENMYRNISFFDILWVFFVYLIYLTIANLVLLKWNGMGKIIYIQTH